MLQLASDRHLRRTVNHQGIYNTDCHLAPVKLVARSLLANKRAYLFECSYFLRHSLDLSFHQESFLRNLAKVAKPSSTVAHRVVIAEALFTVEHDGASRALKQMFTIRVATHTYTVCSVLRLDFQRVISRVDTCLFFGPLFILKFFDHLNYFLLSWSTLIFCVDLILVCLKKVKDLGLMWMWSKPIRCHYLMIDALNDVLKFGEFCHLTKNFFCGRIVRHKHFKSLVNLDTSRK